MIKAVGALKVPTETKLRFASALQRASSLLAIN
jgi:hypothetical protein